MPLIWLTLSFLSGILFSGVMPIKATVWVGIALVSVLAGIIIHRRQPVYHNRFPVPVFFLLLAFSLGGLRFQAGQIHLNANSLAKFNDQGVYTFTARVIAPPDRREDAVYLDLSVLEIEDPLASDPAQSVLAVTGNARARFPMDAPWQYGEVLRFSAQPATPSSEGRFSYKDYLNRKQISTLLYSPRAVQKIESAPTVSLRFRLEVLRQQCQRWLFRLYPQPESGLLAGILLGRDQDLPSSLVSAYQQTGTAHIIAISGFNMSLLALLLYSLFGRVCNRYAASLISAAFLILYTVFVGASPSVVRAALMAVMAFGGHLLGRRQSGVNALAFTAMVMTLLDPNVLWDISFQLSFAATLGLVLFADPLTGWVNKRLSTVFTPEKASRIARPLGDYVLLTLAAQVMTLPIIAWHFGRISLSSLLANPLILPAQPPLLVLGGVSVMLAFISPVLGKAAAFFAWPLAAYSNFIASTFTKIQGASLIVTPQVALWLAILAGLLLALFLFRNFFSKLFAGNLHWGLFILLLGIFSTGSYLVNQPDGKLHLSLLRTGAASSILLQTPSGRAVLFDPQDSANELSATLGGELSPWHYQLDQVWVTGRKKTDVLSALQERIPIHTLVLPPVVYGIGADSPPLTLPEGMELEKLLPGATESSLTDLSIRVIAENHQNAALLITSADARILLPNGVDYALIKAAAPAALSDLTLLVLTEEDLSYIPPRVWESLQPRAILWNSAAISPVEEWISLDGADRLTLTLENQQVLLPAES